MHCTRHSAQRSFQILVSNAGSVETFLPQNLVVLNRHYMDSLNLNFYLWKTNIVITLLYCISTFAINIYTIWPLPVHDNLLLHIDLYFIRCNQCPLHTAPQLVDVSIALFRNQTIIMLVSCCLCGYSSYAPILIW